jgi:hypothetical protein
VLDAGAGHASTLKGPIQRGESSERDGRGVCSCCDTICPAAIRRAGTRFAATNGKSAVYSLVSRSR